jgi:hypothetical protein
MGSNASHVRPGVDLAFVNNLRVFFLRGVLQVEGSRRDEETRPYQKKDKP